MLCDVCTRLGQSIDELSVSRNFSHFEIVDIDGVEKRSRTQAEGYRHHATISNLIEAAALGCELCQLIVEETKSPRRWCATALDLDESQIYTRFLDRPINHQNNGNSMIIFHQGHPDDPTDVPALSTILGIYAYPDDAASQSGFIRGEPVQPMLSASAYAKARSWIEECENSHRRCRTTPDFFPPRVIDVGPIDGSEEPRIVIDETLRAPWVALSHCWGGGISSATLHSNVVPRSEVLPMSHLPLSFQDAITITRALGYRYLWIDALCILQDSLTDWQGHLPNMGKIYQFAVVTIAADVAEDSYGGIILERKQAIHAVPVPYRSLSRGIQGVVYFRQPLDPFPGGPIQTRGWTLQEDLLSVRSLYFSADQLLWQCQKMKISEGDRCPPDKQGWHNFGPKISLKQSFLLPDGQAIAQSDICLSSVGYFDCTPSGEALDHWYLIVNEYVTRNLTVERDRFPALSGIAGQVERRTGYQYIAGLWREDIHVGLLWSTNGTGQKRGNISCPSWSWAGVAFPGSGTINVPYSSWSGARSVTTTSISAVIHSKALVRAVDLDSPGDDIYGVIESGMITIEGKFQHASDWVSRHLRPLIYKKGQRFDLRDLIKKRHYTDPVTDSPQPLCELDYHEHWPDNWTEQNRGEFEAKVAFLQIYRVTGRKDEEVDDLHCRGYEKLRIAYALILESTGNEGEYRRRGIAEIPCEEGMADDGWNERVVKIV